MIVFVPSEPPLRPRVATVPVGGGFQQIVPKINTYNFNKNPTNLIQKGGDDKDIIAESIMNNVDDLIRFLYLSDDGRTYLVQDDKFKKFIANANTRLNKNELDYAYLGEYFNNALVIAPKGEIDGIITGIDTEVDTRYSSQRLATSSPEYYALRQNPTILYIKIDANNFIIVKKEILTSGPTIIIEPRNIKLGTNYSGAGINLTQDQIKTKLGTVASSVVSNFDEEIAIINNANSPALKIAASTIASGASSLSSSGAGVNITVFKKGGGEPSDVPLYESVLTADFNKLNDPKNLFQNNVTVIYFLFNLLRSYELSFITYQEGIESFYTKIDESCVLSDMIGVTNWIPHNIEFYVFLKLILQDYSEKNVNTVNYALFEYYLYLLKSVNNIYYRFQDVKSYLLKTNYEIPFTPEIQSEITSTNMQSLQYFNSVCKRAMQISQNIITQNYNASQSDNLDIIYKNVDDYGLKLCGFTEMKTEFINKTIDIVSSMMSKGLLLKYENVNKEGTSSQDDYANPDANMPDAAGIQPNTGPMQPTPTAAYGGKKVLTSLRKKRRNKNNSKKRRKIYKRKQQTMKKVSKRRKTHRK
jgi:hypothetical protein